MAFIFLYLYQWLATGHYKRSVKVLKKCIRRVEDEKKYFINLTLLPKLLKATSVFFQHKDLALWHIFRIVNKPLRNHPGDIIAISYYGKLLYSTLRLSLHSFGGSTRT